MFSVCVECLDSPQCGPGLECINHKCIVHECDLSAECPQPGVCSNYLCVLYDCFSASDCAAGEACVNHTCVVPPPCVVQEDCPFSYTCIDGACITAECDADAGDWGGEVACGGDTPWCLVSPAYPTVCVECIWHDDCLNGEACKQHQCVVAQCFDHNECPAGFACGTYYKGDPTAPAACIQCAANWPCAAGFICENFLCVVAP